MVAGQEDVDVVVVEIISTVVEVVATAVATSPTEDMVEIIMLLTLLTLRCMLLALLKDVVLRDTVLLKVPQVVVVVLTLLVVPTMLPVLNGDGVTILLVVIGDIKAKVKAMADLPCVLHIVWTSTTRVKKIPTKDTMNSITPTRKTVLW